MKTLLVLALALLSPLGLSALDAEGGIRSVLNAQVAAWNKGDVVEFVSYYTDDCTFVGKTVSQGRDKVLARYQKSYGSKEAMGKLTFTNLVVKPLDGQVAVVTGEFHLERNAAGGGNASGLFSLVFHLKNGHWLIALDHTSS